MGKVELRKADILVQSSVGEDVSWGWDLPSRLFHFATSRRKSEKFDPVADRDAHAYLQYCSSIMDEMPQDSFATTRGSDEEISLPATISKHPLVTLLEQRTSNRRFSGEDIALSDISLVLDQTFRYRMHDKDAYDRMGMHTPTMRRSSPSGGSLQSCEAYLIARKISDLEPGLYHFRSHTGSLAAIKPLPNGFNFGTLLGGQMFAEDLSCALVISCRFDKLMWKYRESRSYRVALLEAGHLSQTALLLATSLDMRTWLTAAFFDDELSSLLELDVAANEYPLLVVGCWLLVLGRVRSIRSINI